VNDLIVPWDENDRTDVDNAIERLFMAQDTRGSRDERTHKRAFLTNELEKLGIPAHAVIAGLVDLLTEDLRAVKLAHIVDKAKDHIEKKEIQRGMCDFCFGSGLIFMLDEKKYEFALRCVCVNGDHSGKKHLAIWNRQETQQRGWIKYRDGDQDMSRHRILTLRFPEIVQDVVPF
jgi:hypothetical protein